MKDPIQSSEIISEPNPCMEISDPAVLAKIPLVSVKMITYNHAPHITKAIEGVLQQETSFQIELIIGEDCSTDGTREIVLNFQRKYPDVIRVITSEKNVGGRKNSERIDKICRGKYIAFCEGDDYWHDPNKLKKQVDYLESHPECGLVYSSYDVYHCDQNKTIRDFIRHRKWRIIENPKLLDFFTEIPIGGSRVGILTCTVILRRCLYEKVIDSDPYLYNGGHFKMSDTQLWAEMINISDAHFFPESMSTHIITEESATRSKDVTKVLRFKISGAELMIYLCKKYNLPASIMGKYEKYRCDNLLRLSYYTRDAKLAEDIRKIKVRLNVLEWLRYFGAKNIFFYQIYGAAAKFKKVITKKKYDWQ